LRAEEVREIDRGEVDRVREVKMPAALFWFCVFVGDSSEEWL